MKFLTAIFISHMVLLWGVTAFAGPIKSCKISFGTRGKPVLISIEGTTTKPCSGSITLAGKTAKKADIKLPLASIDTGIPLRNRHLKENYLHVEKFPTARFTLESGGGGKFKGKLDMNGAVTKVAGTYTVTGKDIEAEFLIDLPDFNMKPPTFMGVTVVDKVRIQVEITVGG